LEIGFNKLHEETQAEELNFWGKILGLERDYYIAQTINFTDKYQIPEKKFYWAISNNIGEHKAYNFQPLPETFVDHLQIIQKNKYNGYFKGTPDEILVKNVEDIDPDDPNAKPKDPTDVDPDAKPKDELQLLEEEEERARNPIIEKRNFTELGRLTFLIRQIDHDTSVFPEGAYKMLPIHEIRKNTNFQGLNPKDLLNLDKYMHLRNVITQEKMELIEKDDVIFRFDFLDSISKDAVKSKLFN
jgi:radial spoke head protein 9